MGWIWKKSVADEANRIAGILADLPSHLSERQREEIYRKEIEKAPPSIRNDILAVSALIAVRKSTVNIQMTTDNSMNFYGNVTNSQVGQTLNDCQLAIQQLPAGEQKDSLAELQS